MPFLLTMSIIVIVIGVILKVASLAVSDPEGKNALKATFPVLLIVAGILMTFSSISTVPVKNVGIVTSFNKPTGETLGAGLKIHAPWERVGDWDASKQQYDHLGTDHDIIVRTSNQADAGVEVFIEWKVKENAAPDQYFDYKKDFELFKNSKINPVFQTAMNDAFASYNPLANIDVKTGNLNVNLKPFADAVKSNLQTGALKDDVEILSVSIPRVNHDEKTTNAINAFADKLAQGRNLDQDKINADKQKLISETNAKVDAVTRCMDNNKILGLSSGPCLQPGFPLIGK